MTLAGSGTERERVSERLSSSWCDSADRNGVAVILLLEQETVFVSVIAVMKHLGWQFTYNNDSDTSLHLPTYANLRSVHLCLKGVDNI